VTGEQSDAEMLEEALAKYEWVRQAYEALTKVRAPKKRKNDPNYMKEQSDWLRALDHREEELHLLIIELAAVAQANREKGLAKYMQLIGGPKNDR
jgi:hypothetical protein